MTIQEFVGMLNFLSKDIYKMQLYLRSFYNIHRQQKTLNEHQKRFDEAKTLLTEVITKTIPEPD